MPPGVSALARHRDHLYRHAYMGGKSCQRMHHRLNMEERQPDRGHVPVLALLESLTGAEANWSRQKSSFCVRSDDKKTTSRPLMIVSRRSAEDQKRHHIVSPLTRSLMYTLFPPTAQQLLANECHCFGLLGETHKKKRKSRPSGHAMKSIYPPSAPSFRPLTSTSLHYTRFPPPSCSCMVQYTEKGNDRVS